MDGLPPSRIAPGAAGAAIAVASAAGDVGKRPGGRRSPLTSLPVGSTAGRAGRPRAFSSGEEPRVWRGGKRVDGDAQRRFQGKKPHGDRAQAALRVGHLALALGRTIFPSTVRRASEVDRIFVSGRNNPKLGAIVAKGAWRGMPLFHLTLEERSTCPRTCSLWTACYGNAMHMARRHHLDAALLKAMQAELLAMAERFPRGFVVRLHTLGDFATPAYAAWWGRALGLIPQLRIFGYTAWEDGTPVASLIEQLNGRFSGRCAIRFSRREPTGRGFEATTIWRQAEGSRVPEGIVCPAQTGRTDCCATCGLCWAPAAIGETIVFMGHGMRGRKAAS